jgi:hypothetical protein
MTFVNYIKYTYERFTFYYFYIDLLLLPFFSRKYPYLIFIFTFFYGTFGYTQSAEIRKEIACLLFSWNLISTSIMIFCVFNVPFTLDYLYNLLAKDFVIKKIGNRGTAQLWKYAGMAAAGCSVNEVGRVTDSFTIPKGAQEGLEGLLNKLEENIFLSEKECQRLV